MRGSRSLTVSLVSVLVALALIGAGAAYAVGSQHRSGVAGRATGVPGSTTAERPTGASTGSAPSTARSAGSTGRTANGKSTGDTSAEPLNVTLSPSAEASAQAQAVADLVVRYFSAINQHDYDAWLTTVSVQQATRDRDSWTADYRTTHDSQVYISDIAGGSRLTVRMQFTSRQSVALAPSQMPLPCVRWDVTYRVVDEGPGLRMGTSVKPPALAPCT